MTIGKAYESTKIEVQECSANRPPAKESINAGAHGFSDNSAPPGEQSTESEKKKSFLRLKDRSKKCKQFQKGIQEKHSDHKQSKSSTKQFVLRVEEDGEDSLLSS